MENPGVIIPIILLVGIIAVFISTFAKSSREAKSSEDESLTELDRNTEFESEPVAVRARVISKEVDGYYSGAYQTPSYHTAFTVTFLTDSGETKEFNVQKETFDRIKENQYGLLITLNGTFFDFGDGEDVTAEEE